METQSSSTTIPGLFERFNNWLQESVMIKLFSIGFLVLVLLIPVAWITELIYERQSRANSVIDEVAAKWSGAQTVSGPILVIPYKHIDKIDKGKDGVEIRESVQNAYFLPETLNIDGTIAPEQLKRGIFDVVVYKSSLKVQSTFGKPDFERLKIPADMVLWKDAYMVCGISDHRGISENPAFTVGGQKLPTEPSQDIGVSLATTPTPVFHEYDDVRVVHETTSSSKGIVAKLNWQDETAFTETVSMQLDLKGSKRLDFVPTGKTTDVKLSGAWQDPSFDGAMVPAVREIDENGFRAAWKVLHFNRPFSQQWTGGQTLSGADFGVRLLVPVDQYQKSMRTAKYGILVILLTFVALFLVEITQKIRIHPFQYILIGAALTIYYTLLLSFSEHLGYNTAYIVASLATVGLVGLYSRTFIPETRLVLVFTALLAVFYTFIFVITVQQDYALLIGSVGLFVIVGTLMYFSRRINWYAR